MQDANKQFKVIGYRKLQQRAHIPSFEKIVYGRSEASRLAVMLKNAAPSYDEIIVVNGEGRTILNITGET